jgi:integrase
VLTLARETGRRVKAICHLHVSDVLLTTEQMERALAEAGLPVAHAEYWPHGAIRWSKAYDKKGYEAVAPLSRTARNALDLYLRRAARAGDVLLFPGRHDPTKPVTKETAGYWLTRAETLAKLPHLARGGFHPFRRLWASERRHLPDADVSAAGGWRSIPVMRESYQHADARRCSRSSITPRSPKRTRRGRALDTLWTHPASKRPRSNTFHDWHTFRFNV